MTEEQAIYPFDRKFRLKILLLCLDNKWMTKYGNFIILPEYFEQDDEEKFVRSVLTYRAKYKVSPSDSEDVKVLMKGEHCEFVDDIYGHRGKWDTKLASDMAVQFAQEQAAKLAILDSVDDVMDGNIQVAIERMRNALKVGQEIDYLGIDPYKDVETWLYDYWSGKVSTGWPWVDLLLDGGLNGGEEGIILGPQNKGKSMSLVNLGYAGASMVNARNVIHFTHEMSDKQTAKRYAARTVFRFPKRVDNLDEYAEELVLAARSLVKGKVRIIHGKMTTSDMEDHINRLIDDGFEPGLIIDDYPDLLETTKYYKEDRYRLSAVYKWFRDDIADYYGIPVWGASQATRGAYDKEIITLKDIAEDIGKASVADVIISLCQTSDEEKVDQCRLFLAKVRDGDSRGMVQCKYYKGSQAIVATGFAKSKENGNGT